MKKYIIQRIKDSILETNYDWAKNYVAKKWQEQFDTPEAKKQVESANLNMTKCEEKTVWLNKLLKNENRKA